MRCKQLGVVFDMAVAAKPEEAVDWFKPTASLKELFGELSGQPLVDKVFSVYQAGLGLAIVKSRNIQANHNDGL